MSLPHALPHSLERVTLRSPRAAESRVQKSTNASTSPPNSTRRVSWISTRRTVWFGWLRPDLPHPTFGASTSDHLSEPRVSRKRQKANSILRGAHFFFFFHVLSSLHSSSHRKSAVVSLYGKNSTNLSLTPTRKYISDTVFLRVYCYSSFSALDLGLRPALS